MEEESAKNNEIANIILYQEVVQTEDGCNSPIEELKRERTMSPSLREVDGDATSQPVVLDSPEKKLDVEGNAKSAHGS